MDCKAFLEQLRKIKRLEVVVGEYECSCGSECKHEEDIYYEGNRLLDFIVDCISEEKAGGKTVVKVILVEDEVRHYIVKTCVVA